VSAALILLVVVAVIAGGIFALWSPAQKWFAAAPHTLSVIQHKLSGIILAIPGLVALKVAAEYHRHGKPLVEFLSASTAKRFAPRKRSSKSAGATVVA
jgi:hypothetical protein